MNALSLSRPPAGQADLPAGRETAGEEAAAERLAGALRFRTISKESQVVAGEEFLGLHAFLQRSFPRVHQRLERRVFSKYSLLYIWHGSDPALDPVLLLAHQDVVPVQEPESWEHPPFAGVRENGFIIGRGALDDKVAVVGILEAVEGLLARGFRPERTVYLAFGHDEEIGGRKGAGEFARQFRRQGVRFASILDEGMIIADGLIPGVERPAALIGVAAKGHGYLELKIAGQSGHSSMPPPSTAIGILSRAVTRLEENPMSAALEGPMAAMFDHLSPHMNFAGRFVFANRALLEPLIVNRMTAVDRLNAGLRTTMAVTIFDGGVKGNLIPAEARAVVNIRVHPRDTVAGIVEHARRVIDDERVRIRVVSDETYGASGVSPVDARPYRLLSDTIQEVFPETIVAPALFMASSDSRHFQDLSDNIHRFRPTRFAKTDLNRLHGVNERIAEENYAGHIRFYGRLIERWAGES